MNLLKKLEIGKDFSSSEKQIANYILNSGKDVLNLSTIELAKATYTSPSTIVRLCRKLGFKKYNDFKVNLASSFEYLISQNNDINANFPIKKQENITHISHKISTLYIESIQETQRLLSEEELRKSIILLDKADIIDIYGVSNPLRMAEDFQYKMFRIGKQVKILSMINEQLFQAAQSNEKHCALVISYSGETPEVIEACKLLKKKRCPIIGITSIGDNQLSTYCNHILHLDSRETIYNKIGTIGSTVSIHMILDILYTGFFARNFDSAVHFKLSTDHIIDNREK